MKKPIILIAMAIFGFSASAQSCCASKKTAKACCAKKAATTTEASAQTTASAMLVSNKIDHNETAKFTVYGNCGMCKRTIEGALKEVKGIKSAEWNVETDEMTVTYNPHKIQLDNIKQKIADVGYDTDSHRAKDSVYENLPGCCQYERPVDK
ncbi:MAG: mercuric ion binding protein [Paraglaciecola sp.]|jgi:mercuric ion binding protein